MAEKIKISDLFDFSDVQNLQELTKRLEQINQIYKELAKNIGQESKVINKGLEDNVKEIEKLAKALKTASDVADIKKLTDEIEKQAAAHKKLTAQNEKLVEQNKKLKESQKVVNEEGKEAVRLAKEQEKLKAKISKATGEEAKQNAILKLELQRVNKETKKQAKEASGLGDAYDRLRERTAKAKREALKLGAEFGKTSKQFQDAAQKANKLSTELDGINNDIGNFQSNVGNYSSALDGIGQGFSSVLEFATPAGLALAGVALAIEGIGALAEVVSETNQQLKETSQLTGLTGEQLTTFTSQVRTTAKVFDQEYKEVLRSANAVSKEFGITGAEAIDLINNGFVQGANINDDYLDQLREYSTQFKAAGLTAQDFNNVVALGAKEGIFNDKAADTVKEGGLRLREFTKATSDALIPLGKLRNEQIANAVASGNSFEAIQLVSQGLKEVELTAGQTQGIITNVFGGPGEDAGIRFIELLGDIDTNQKNVNANLTEQQKRINKVIEVEEKLANAEVKLGQAFKNSGQEIGLFFTQLQTLGIEGLLSVIEEVKKEFNELVEPVNEIKTEFNELLETFGLTGGGVLDFIKKFNPLVFLFDQFVFTVKVVIAFVGELLSALNTGVDIVKDFTNNIIEFATSFDIVNTVVAKLTNALNDFFAIFTDAPKFFRGFLAATEETFNQFSKITKQSLTGTKDLILSLFTFNPTKVKEAFSKSIPVIEGSGEAIALAFKKGFDSVDVITVDPKKIDEVVKKVEKPKTKEASAISKESIKKTKDLQDKALQERLEAINNAAAEEKLLATERINQGLITEQEYQDELLLIELRRLETLQDAQEAAGKSTIATEQQIQDILLKDKQAGIKLGEEQDKKNAKTKAKIKKAEDKAKLEAEKEATEARKERANDPLAQAGFDALEGKIKNELVLAGVQAFRSSLENGDDVQTALQNGTKAVAAGQLFKSLSEGFHDGGFTGEGNEYDVAGVVHKGEFVNTKQQTSKYNMKGWNANDFDTAIDTGYFRQFEDTNNQLSESMVVNKQIVVNNNNQDLVRAINDLPNKMPVTDMSFYGKDLQQRTKTGSVTKTKTFRGVR